MTNQPASPASAAATAAAVSAAATAAAATTAAATTADVAAADAASQILSNSPFLFLQRGSHLMRVSVFFFHFQATLGCCPCYLLAKRLSVAFCRFLWRRHTVPSSLQRLVRGRNWPHVGNLRSRFQKRHFTKGENMRQWYSI